MYVIIKISILPIIYTKPSLLTIKLLILSISGPELLYEGTSTPINPTAWIMAGFGQVGYYTSTFNGLEMEFGVLDNGYGPGLHVELLPYALGFRKLGGIGFGTKLFEGVITNLTCLFIFIIQLY